jgi:hypothetical protein
MRRCEKLVSGRKPGDRPSHPASPEAKRHTLRFEVSAEVLATFRDPMAKLRRELGGKLDDDEALLPMAPPAWRADRCGSLELPGFVERVRTMPARLPARWWRSD